MLGSRSEECVGRDPPWTGRTRRNEDFPVVLLGDSRWDEGNVDGKLDGRWSLATAQCFAVRVSLLQPSSSTVPLVHTLLCFMAQDGGGLLFFPQKKWFQN